MARFIHTADWQLGMTRHFLEGEAQARFTQARLDAIRSIGELATREDCTFVVVAGDVFESNHVERQVVLRALDAMAATPEVTFFLLPGNHDPLDAACVFRSATFVDNQPPNVVVIDSTEPIPVGGTGDSRDVVEIVGAPWRNKRPLEDLVTAALPDSKPEGERLRVVVGHGAIDYLCPDDAHPATITLDALEGALADGRVHYVALGDRHSVTQVGATGAIHYSGAPEPTDFDEVEPGNVLVVDLDANGARVSAHSVATWRFGRERFEVSASEDLESLRSYLDSFDDTARTILRIGLVGQLSLGENAELEDLLSSAADRFAAVDHWQLESDLVIVPDEEDFETLGLIGYADEALGDLRDIASGDAADQRERALAGEAMRLLYRLNSERALEGTGVGS